MFLKKLEVHGFKSFSDRTELLFEPGITAIVGPNGCGKTNVADSIRWVMGEQSAKGLRASEMTDVIFNGTESRKPSGMSEVTLVLSNEDKTLPLEFNEVSITRRVYRSGESEYLINQAPVRLKDVKELFMGTGLGISAYSVMAQGQIEQIVTSNPIERRSLFEEAAGITKFKSRKIEALRKLEATEQNLVRISDIIAELKRQIHSLERQAKQAEKYRQFKEKLGMLQIQIHLDKSAKLKAKSESLHRKINEVQERLEEAQENAAGLEQGEKQLRARLADIEQELAKVREQAYKVSSEVEVTQGRLEGTRRHKNMLADQRQRNDQQTAEASGRTEQLKVWVAERSRLQETKESQKQEKALLEQELQARMEALESEWATKSRDLDAMNLTAVELVTKSAQMKAELESLQAQDEETSRRVADLAAQLEKNLGELKAITEKGESLHTCKKDAQSEEARLEENLLGFQAALAQQGALIAETDEELKRLNNAFSEARSRYGVLVELQNKLTGYDAGVKTILQARQSEPLMWQEVLGVVADLISVDKVHEAAVETLLGSQLQSLVVRHRSTAEKVVDYLKSEGQGKVSLLILEDLAKQAQGDMPSQALTEPGVLGSMSSFLKYDPALEPVVRFLFGQDLLASDWSLAENLSVSHPRLRFVTMEGDRMGPLGSLKAGSVATGVSLLGRHREMNELMEKMTDLENQVQQAEAKLAAAKKNRKETEDSLLASENRRQQIRILLAETEKEIAQSQETLLRLENEKTSLEKEKSQWEAHWNADKNRIGELSGLLSQSERAQHSTQEEINEARAGLQALQTQKEEVSRQRMQARLELDSLEEVAERAREEAERYQAELDQLARLVTQKKEENQQLGLQEQQLSLDLEDLDRRIGGLSQSKKDADEQAGQVSEKRAALSAETEALAEKVRQARLKFEEVQKELHALDLQEAQISVEIRNIEEKLQLEYKVDPENPPVALEKDFDGETAERESIELRAKIDRLGLVNMVAMEEYDELSQRYKFLVEQQEDLLKAKDDLQKAIHKINLTSKELFTSTFATVQENFKDVFQRLFEGGRAELILVDEGNVLESGIEIVARPPGKRLQSVSLLSGGEKALTAIALLFALFLVKPSPFCLLDEIDAPLDDVNVGRFTNLLKEFSKRTQFIMITHNKVSMETADVIYGVTMQESGVSKIVSAKFKENRPEETAVS